MRFVRLSRRLLLDALDKEEAAEAGCQGLDCAFRELVPVGRGLPVAPGRSTVRLVLEVQSDDVPLLAHSGEYLLEQLEHFRLLVFV